MTGLIKLFQKEIRLEFRNRFSFSSIVLYTLTAAFLSFTIVKKVSVQLWIALYWITIIFAASNATTRSFYQESGDRQLFYYQLSNPINVIFAKLLYNTLLLWTIGIINWLCFAFFSGSVIIDPMLFLAVLFVGSTALSTIYTFVSSIAGKTPNTAAMMAVMSFPLLIPVVLTVLKLTAQSCNLVNDTSYWKDFLILMSIDGLLIGALVFLFPYVWKD